MNGTTRRRSPGRKGTPSAEPKTKLPQTVGEVLKKHVTLEVECIDRMYLNAIVPRLQITRGRWSPNLPEDPVRVRGPDIPELLRSARLKNPSIMIDTWIDRAKLAA